jgi:hypothetical protein
MRERAEVVRKPVAVSIGRCNTGSPERGLDRRLSVSSPELAARCSWIVRETLPRKGKVLR